MSQNKELASVKDRIKKLLARTVENGCTEAEALLAADKVADLLSTFNLSMSEIELREQTCETVVFRTKKTKTAVYYSWTGIAKLCGVKPWRSVESENYAWKFFGLEQDANLAEYLCQLIETSLLTALAEFRESAVWTGYDGHRRTLTSNFIRGFGNRMNSRLISLADENARKEREYNKYHAENSTMVGATDEAKVKAANATTGTAIISMEKSKIIDEEFKKLGMKLSSRKTQRTMRYNSSANSAGSSAASKVNLSRPITGGKRKTSGYIT